MSDVIHVRGEGGAVFRMALPLEPNVAKRFEAGEIVRVNPDGSEWTEPAKRPRKPAAKNDGDA